MLDNVYWIFSFLKDKCDFSTLTAHLLKRNRRQSPQTLKISKQGCGFCSSCFFFLIAETKHLIGSYLRQDAFSLAQLEGPPFTMEVKGWKQEYAVTGHVAQEMGRGYKAQGLSTLTTSSSHALPKCSTTFSKQRHLLETNSAPVGNPSHSNHNTHSTQICPQLLDYSASRH